MNPSVERRVRHAEILRDFRERIQRRTDARIVPRKLIQLVFAGQQLVS